MIDPYHVPPALAEMLNGFEQRWLKRFWSYVRKTDTCWIWTGPKDDYGYGRASTGRTGPRAHRLTWEMANGPIVGDVLIRHTCDVPACVNPAHLIPGTHLDNARDRDARGRSGTIGVNNAGAKLTEDQVREIRRRWTGEWGQGLAMCREFKIKSPALYRIVNGTGWKHVK